MSIGVVFVLVLLCEVLVDVLMLLEIDLIVVVFGYKVDVIKVDKMKYLKYVVGQDCVVCMLYQGKKGLMLGLCGVFFGKQVVVKGWCSVFLKMG